MIEVKVRKQGNSFVITIPREEMETYQLKEGDEVAVALTKLEKRAVLRPELQKVADEILEEYKDVFVYLADK